MPVPLTANRMQLVTSFGVGSRPGGPGTQLFPKRHLLMWWSGGDLLSTCYGRLPNYVVVVSSSATSMRKLQG